MTSLDLPLPQDLPLPARSKMTGHFQDHVPAHRKRSKEQRASNSWSLHVLLLLPFHWPEFSLCDLAQLQRRLGNVVSIWAAMCLESWGILVSKGGRWEWILGESKESLPYTKKKTQLSPQYIHKQIWKTRNICKRHEETCISENHMYCLNKL